MKLFNEREILNKNRIFSLITEGERHFFLSNKGLKVETCVLGKALWESLPGNIVEIKKRIRKDLLVSANLIEKYLYILYRGDLLSTSSRADEKESIPQTKKEFGDLVSVIVVTYNGQKHVKEFFQSVFRQSYNHMEVIAVDNASQDETINIIKNNYPRVKIFSMKKNRHFARAVNQGIKLAKGKYFFILNQDIELDKDCIYQLLIKAKQAENAGAVVPLMKFYHLRGFINGLGNQIRDYGWGSDNFIGCVDIGQFQTLKEVPSACFGAVLLDRDAVTEVGYLDEKYKSYYEDVDWSFRCWFKGWKIIPAPKSIVFHKFGGSYKEDKRKLKFVVRNRQRLVLKIFQGKVRWGFLKRYFKEDVKSSLSLLKRKKYSLFTAYPTAYFSLVLSLPHILFLRHVIIKNKIKHIREKDIIKKNPEFYSSLNSDNEPVLDSKVIFGYYFRLL